MASDTEFPEAKAPFRLLRTNFDATHIRLKSHMPPHGRQGDLLPAARPLLGGALQKLLPETQPLLFSEVCLCLWLWLCLYFCLCLWLWLGLCYDCVCVWVCG